MNRFLTGLMFSLLAVSLSGPVMAEDAPMRSGRQVLEPELERRDVAVPTIQAEDYELGLNLGILSIEDFDSNPVASLELNYHITEDYFFQATLAGSSVSDTAFRQLGAPVFPEEHADLLYYSFSLGVNLFPGEIFIGDKRAFASHVYLLAGAGNTSFAEEDYFTFTFGGGLRLLPQDWYAIHFRMLDHIFQSDLLGELKSTHNFEASLGVSYFF